MQTFSCRCGNPLFYENTHCLACQSEVGWCPACSHIVALAPLTNGGYRCTNPSCNAALMKCHNYAVENVCNRMVVMHEGHADTLCACCRYNAVIPDLAINGHRERWAALEAAKRRLFHTLDLLSLPHGTEGEDIRVPLSFSFMADALPDQGLWRSTASQEKVYTGHANGHITINVKEADDVERERLRVDMNESHRTLIGHFRHEIGHYYWDLLVKERDEQAFCLVFGDHNYPTYADALEHYYQQGSPSQWQAQFISAYAAMHPWEDFAETFAFYLDMVAVLDTALHMGLSPAEYDGTLDSMLLAFHQVGLAVNELNRDMGLLDLAPGVIAPAVRDKLAYVHELIQSASASSQPA
ncbi:putative zinc-binding metallopeptidase [Halomonas sp. M1]|uniref:zinc-binding metallopeptidase family protein n=1 Tax=Halomonas sp. M1 TaxID=3035470 RepID=UPI002485169B|nr:MULTISPECIES: putative zinc-binding metallopeptidase [unclassified Halomonas]MDP3536581.1 putative zinc-binding metallopeptidase [Halomonas sp.]WFE71250.1 putative zinc-binding metallopeptidase [Halomonas sp. M1]